SKGSVHRAVHSTCFGLGLERRSNSSDNRHHVPWAGPTDERMAAEHSGDGAVAEYVLVPRISFRVLPQCVDCAHAVRQIPADLSVPCFSSLADSGPELANGTIWSSCYATKRTTPPSTRKAAPVVAEACSEHV